MKYLLIAIFTIFNFHKTIPPPGTVYLKDNIYIDEEYISIQSWKEYVMLKEYNNEIAFYPDTSYIVNGLNYYNSGVFDEKPISRISYEAMQSYIQWRTDYINSSLENFSMKNKCRPKFYVKNYKKNIRVLYKIASKEDYLEAFEKGLLTKTDKNECFTKENWTKNSTFRCVASFYSL